MFYASLWECVAANPAIRLAAISFVLRHIDRKIPIMDQVHLLGGNSCLQNRFTFEFIYSDKATKFCEISTVDLSYVCSNGQIYSGNFAKLCGLLRIFEQGGMGERGKNVRKN